MNIVIPTLLFFAAYLPLLFASRAKSKKWRKIGLFANIVLSFAVVLSVFAVSVSAEEVQAAVTAGMTTGQGLGLLGAALSTGLACIGAGIAVSHSASAAIGAISEDPKVFGKALIFVALAEGVALYGMLISIQIIGLF